MITLKFHDGLLQVKESQLREIPFFKAMLDFEKSDVLVVDDVLCGAVQKILDGTYFVEHLVLFDFLGAPLEKEQLIHTRGRILQKSIICEHTYDEFMLVTATVKFYGFCFGERVYYFSEDLKEWLNCDEDIVRYEDLMMDMMCQYGLTKITQMQEAQSDSENAELFDIMATYNFAHDSFSERLKKIFAESNIDGFKKLYDDFIQGKFKMDCRDYEFLCTYGYKVRPLYDLANLKITWESGFSLRYFSLQK